MNRRERVRSALNHKEPDRVPLDLGSSVISTIQVPVYEELLTYLGMQENIKILQKTGNTADLSDQMRNRLGIDFVGMRMNPGQPTTKKVSEPGNLLDDWGIEWKKSNYDSGIYYSVKHPLSNGFELDELDAVLELPDFTDPLRVKGLKEKAKHLYENTDYALVGDLMFTITQRGADLMGMENYFCDLLLDEVKIGKLLEKVCQVNLDGIRLFLKEVGEYLDVVAIADDLGTQSGPMISPNVYRNIIKPLHMEMIKEIRKHTKAKIMMHNDGAIKLFIPDIIDAGFDILNPIQTSATGMDPIELKREFGSELTFWGGIDSQSVMGFGDVKAVQDEVKRKIDIFAPGGGYVCGNIHNITCGVKPENVIALFDTAQSYGKYRKVESK